MKATTLLVIAFTAFIAVQRTSADSYVKSEKSQQSAASASAEAAVSDEEIRASDSTGEYESKSRKATSKAAAQASQSSKEVYEARNTGGSCGGGSVEESSQSERASSAGSQAASSQSSEEIKKKKKPCGCAKKVSKAVSEKKPCGCGKKVAKAVTEKKPCGCGKKVAKAVTEKKPCGCGKKIAKAVTEKKPCGCKQGGILGRVVPRIGIVENLRNWVATNFKQRSGEDVDSYFKRITCKDGVSDNDYVKRLTIARGLFSNLDLWYVQKYFPCIQKFYSLVFARKAQESDDCYYKRLLTKENYETEDNWAKRINLLRDLFPSLTLWYDEQCYTKYAKHFFQVFYKKATSEPSESYLKRVFRKVNGESDKCFWKRVKLVQKTFPKYSCWYDKENLKKIDVCKKFSNVQNEQDLKKQVLSQDSSDCNQDQIGVLQTFFRSSSSSSSSSSSLSSSEESTTIRSSN